MKNIFEKSFEIRAKSRLQSGKFREKSFLFLIQIVNYVVSLFSEVQHAHFFREKVVKTVKMAYHIANLLEKMTSADKDYRFMATNDLMSELQKDSIKLDDDSEKKVGRTSAIL